MRASSTFSPYCSHSELLVPPLTCPDVRVRAVCQTLSWGNGGWGGGKLCGPRGSWLGEGQFPQPEDLLSHCGLPQVFLDKVTMPHLLNSTSGCPCHQDWTWNVCSFLWLFSRPSQVSKQGTFKNIREFSLCVVGSSHVYCCEIIRSWSSSDFYQPLQSQH